MQLLEVLLLVLQQWRGGTRQTPEAGCRTAELAVGRGRLQHVSLLIPYTNGFEFQQSSPGCPVAHATLSFHTTSVCVLTDFQKRVQTKKVSPKDYER